MPFVPGHEVVGDVTEVGSRVTRVSVGDRVVLHPALGCEARGIEPPCDACAVGRGALCRNVTRGDVSSGIQTGFCRDTGGGFSGGFVAHESQTYLLPSHLSDVAAVLIEPFACALHGALRVSLNKADTALVLGCGSIGLLTIAALRASGCQARIVAAAKYDHQRQHARALGADQLLDARGPIKSRYAQWADVLHAEIVPAALGKPLVIGGASATFDCVASSGTIDDGLRFTKSAGTFILVGMPGMPWGVDWTAMWYKELMLRAAYAYGPEQYAGGERDTFDIAIDLMRTWSDKLVPLVGPPFELRDYRAALASALNTGRSCAIKTVFAIHGVGR